MNKHEQDKQKILSEKKTKEMMAKSYLDEVKGEM